MKPFTLPLLLALPLLSPATLAGSAIEQRMEYLEQRLLLLEARVQQQATELQEKEAQLARLQKETTEEAPGKPAWAHPGVTIEGALELEAYHSIPYAGPNENDLAVASAVLALNASIAPWLEGEISLLYEEDETPLEVDTATITLAPVDRNWRITAGQTYVPFGTYESMMLSDPMTLELGEARETALIATYQGNGLQGTLYAFNGDNRKGEENRIDNWGATLGYQYESDTRTAQVAIGFINDLGESDALQELLAGTSEGLVADHTGAWTANISYSEGPFTLMGEILAARDRFQPDEMQWNGAGAKPQAWNIEAGVHFDLAGYASTLAVGYQQSRQALALGLPARRTSATLSLALMENVSLSFEWQHERDYDAADSAIDEANEPVAGTGKTADTLTTQLAIGF